jgi:hypothetical protein
LQTNQKSNETGVPRFPSFRSSQFEMSSMQHARISAVLDQVSRPPRFTPYPHHAESKRPMYLSEVFGENVFTVCSLQYLQIKVRFKLD